jgi:predicted AAA+ superfamily ATPase
VEAEDRGRTVPGAAVWRQLIEDRPVLILLDELAPYLRVLKSSQEYGQMAGAVAPFLKGLLETVASSRRAMCVLTLAEASDAFGQEIEELGRALTELVSELKTVSARVERTLTPTAGEDGIGQIVVHRLLESVDAEAAREASRAYREAYDRWQRQGADLPSARKVGRGCSRGLPIRVPKRVLGPQRSRIQG